MISPLRGRLPAMRSRKWYPRKDYRRPRKGCFKPKGGIGMKDFRKISTTQLWQAIEDNAKEGQRHMDWWSAWTTSRCSVP